MDEPMTDARVLHLKENGDFLDAIHVELRAEVERLRAENGLCSDAARLECKVSEVKYLRGQIKNSVGTWVHPPADPAERDAHVWPDAYTLCAWIHDIYIPRRPWLGFRIGSIYRLDESDIHYGRIQDADIVAYAVIVPPKP